MKVIRPDQLYCMRKVEWQKPDFYMHTSIYAGFNYGEDSEEWLPQTELLELVQEVSQKCIFDNCSPRAQGECLVFLNDNTVKKVSLRISDIFKEGKKEEFLALPLTDEHYKKTSGTFDDKWLKTRWPALPKDHKPEVFQIAPKDQRSDKVFKWGDTFKIRLDDDENGLQSFPFKKIQLFSLDKANNFDEIKIKPDVVWLFPSKKQGIIIAHGSKQVKDNEASNLAYLYLADMLLDDEISKEQHLSNLNEKIALKKPSFKPAEMKKPEAPKVESSEAPKVEVPAKKPELDPEVEKIKSDMEAKLAEIKAKYADHIDDNPEKNLPDALKSVMNEQDPKIASDKVKTYMDQKLNEIQQKLISQFPEKKEEILNPPKLTMDETIAALGASLASSIGKAKANLAKEEADKLPDPKELTDEIAAKIKEMDANEPKVEEAVEKQKIQIVYKDNDFSYQNLTNRDFTGLDLSNANFTGADLSGAIFKQSKLSGTNFSESKLNQALFEDLRIIDCNFSSAIMHNNIFKAITINDTQFNETDLTGLSGENVNIRGCELSSARIPSSNLKSFTFHKCELNNVNLDYGTIAASMFNQCDSKKILLNQSKLNSVTFFDVNFDDIQCVESNLSKCQINKSNFLQGSFELSEAEKLTVNDAKFDNICFKEVNFPDFRMDTSSSLNNCDFENANLTKFKCFNAKLENCHFTKTNLVASQFRFCELPKMHLNKVLAQNSNFYSCDLTGSYVEKSNLLEVNIRCSTLNDASFINSNLYDVSFYQSVIDNVMFEKNLVNENFELTKSVQKASVQ
jgi:uncharacterized protein YjbI with pentapeptide repeats